MKSKFEDLEIFQLSEKLADTVWEMVIKWDDFPKKTVEVSQQKQQMVQVQVFQKDQEKGVTWILEDILEYPAALCMKQSIGLEELIKGI